MQTLVLFLSLIMPSASDVIIVDIIELNSFCDVQGGLVFDQWILWRWSKNPTHGWRYDIVEWRLTKDVRIKFDDEHLKQETRKFAEEWHKLNPLSPPPPLIPEIDWTKINLTRGKEYTLIFIDSKYNQPITIKSKLFKHTYTYVDKELVEREFLADNLREKPITKLIDRKTNEKKKEG